MQQDKTSTEAPPVRGLLEHTGESGAPLVVAALSDNLVENSITAAGLGADAIEIRLDLLESTRGIQETLQRVRSKGQLPIIITNRCREEGGGWRGDERERVALLRQLLPLADAVDIELAAPHRDDVVSEAKRLGRTLIISSHDFTTTPPLHRLREILEEEHSAGADISKLAVTPGSPQDVLNLLQAGLDAGFPVCIIAMGALGRHTRVISGIYGSRLTYASIDKNTAPGQLRVDTLKNILQTISVTSP